MWFFSLGFHVESDLDEMLNCNGTKAQPTIGSKDQHFKRFAEFEVLYVWQGTQYYVSVVSHIPGHISIKFAEAEV